MRSEFLMIQRAGLNSYKISIEEILMELSKCEQLKLAESGCLQKYQKTEDDFGKDGIWCAC